ncbi:MAG: membrane protein insertion efficiency factor YidD [Ruminococcaceae bacterium]|nr:membrane protein insertion efficiency factor YidD [Oscillospiraceae bacterium]
MKSILIWLIRFYQRRISPQFPPCCRFRPTCSQYALEAVSKYGALRGGYLALRRLLRCNPFNHGDYNDPVP